MNQRRIRVLIAKPGLDGHDVGAKLVCRALMAAGMDVTYTGLRQSPEEIVAVALQEDVDVLGLSILSGAHMALCQRLRDEMADKGLKALLIVGGNIPRRDHESLKSLGVDAVFNTGTSFGDIEDLITSRVER